jgi:hypothetical protein
MTVDEITKLLVEANDRKTLEVALHAALQQWDDVCPILLQAMDSTPTLEESEASELIFFGMYLVAEKRETAAFPLLIKFFSSPGEDAVTSTGDVVTESLHNILASTFNGDLNSLKSLIENRDIYEYTRMAGLRTMLTLLHEGVLQRCDVVDYFRQLMHPVTEDDETFNGFLISCCCDMHPAELKEDILRLFEAEVVEELMIGWESVEEAGNRMPLESFAPHTEGCYQFIHSTFDELSQFPAFYAPTKRNASKPKENYNKLSEKVGRNDPCPCGSGKKYKKCCLNSNR